MRERDGASTLVAAFLRNNATIKKYLAYLVGEAMEERSDLGGTCGMTQCHRSGRRIDRQIIKEKKTRGLKRSPNDANTHSNQPKTARRDGAGIREDARPAGSTGGVRCDRFGCDRAQLM